MFKAEIKAVIGLGNPGRQYLYNRHNIGFLVLDALADRYGASWRAQDHAEVAMMNIGDKRIHLTKPQTFMNSSGKVIPALLKQGIKPENILVVHDELEIPFGKFKLKMGGSAKGHNGLRSIIEQCGPDFARLAFGIGRPERKEMVGNYVLQNFTEDRAELERLINEAVDMLEVSIKGE